MCSRGHAQGLRAPLPAQVPGAARLLLQWFWRPRNEAAVDQQRELPAGFSVGSCIVFTIPSHAVVAVGREVVSMHILSEVLAQDCDPGEMLAANAADTNQGLACDWVCFCSKTYKLYCGLTVTEIEWQRSPICEVAKLHFAR